jgi:hypothetical protein
MNLMMTHSEGPCYRLELCCNVTVNEFEGVSQSISSRMKFNNARFKTALLGSEQLLLMYIIEKRIDSSKKNKTNVRAAPATPSLRQLQYLVILIQ